MINRLKHALACYRLGKFILNNIHRWPDFRVEADENTVLFKATSSNVPAKFMEMGKIHSVCFIDNERFSEASIFVEDEKA